MVAVALGSHRIFDPWGKAIRSGVDGNLASRWERVWKDTRSGC